MNVRLATAEDLRAVIGLSERAHGEAPHYRRSRFVREKIEQLGEGAVGGNPGLVLLVAERGGEIVGYLFGVVSEHYFSDALYAASISLYVAPEARGGRAAFRLLQRFEAEARARGAGQIQLGASVDAFAPAALRLYRALGYTVVGTLVVKYLE